MDNFVLFICNIMPSKSEKQRRFFDLVKAVQKGEKKAHEVSPEVRKVANSISVKDAGDFASSVAELKIKKAVLSVLKDCREPMYLNEIDEESDSIDPIASTFHVKEDWSIYIKSYIGQPFSQKDLEAVDNFKEKHPTTIARTEIWYKTSDTFSVSITTVIKKMKDSGQFSFTAFQKNEKPDPNDKNQDKNGLDDLGQSPMGQMTPTNDSSVDTSSQEQQNKKDENDNKEDIIITKSILFKDDIKGAAILIEFLKKLEL